MSKKSKKLRKRVRKANRRRFLDPYVTNCHHCLWIGKKWDSGHYSRLLRNYWYCKLYIPANTIHKLIHEELVCIPVPPEDVCRRVYYSLMAMEERGELSQDDREWSRIKLLISLFGDSCPDTTDALSKEEKIIEEFYNRAAK